MSDQNLPADDEEEKNKLLTEICHKLDSEARIKLGLKIPRLQVYAYNKHTYGEVTGEVIFKSMLDIWDRISMRIYLLLGGFDNRSDSLNARSFSENEAEMIEKFFFNFCCINGLKYKPCKGILRTDLADPKSITYSFQLMDDLFLVHDKL